MAQTARPVRDLQNPASTRVTIDLDGKWEAPDERGADYQPLSVTIQHQGSALRAVESAPNSPLIGQTVFSASYSGERRFLAQFADDEQGNPGRRMEITLQDPDTFSVNGFDFHRASAPKLNDIACDPGNPLHVTGGGAVARTYVAAHAGDASSTYCWASLAASAGEPEGEYLKGACLREGYGVARDAQAAFHWIQLSAQHKNLSGRTAVAEMLERGEGTPRDRDMASRWSLLAFNQRIAAGRTDGEVQEWIWTSLMKAKDEEYQMTRRCGGTIDEAEFRQRVRLHPWSNPCPGQ
ncbi:MAG: tetratricopeptide repeat protein [Bryobacteraceae bacterium]